MSEKKGLGKLFEAAKSFSPSAQIKEGVVEIAKDGLGKATEIIKNVQDGKMQIAEGLQAIQELKINTEAELEKARLSDVRDARSMNEKAIQSNDKFIRRFSYYLALISVICTFTLLVLLYFIEIPTGNERIVDMALGSFVGAVLTIYAFYYGSTQNDQNQSGVLTKIVEKIAKKGNQNL